MKKISLLLIVVLASCSPTIPTYTVKFAGNAIQVPVGGFDNTNYNIVHDDTSPFDILLVKDSPLAYRALYMKCPHDEKALDLFPDQTQLVCPVCRSVFDYNGSTISGPSENPLVRFSTELNPDQTLVRIDITPLGL